jgi:hypothetical protein
MGTIVDGLVASLQIPAEQDDLTSYLGTDVDDFLRDERTRGTDRGYQPAFHDSFRAETRPLHACLVSDPETPARRTNAEKDEEKQNR